MDGFTLIDNGKYKELISLCELDLKNLSLQDEQGNLFTHHLAFINQSGPLLVLIRMGVDITITNYSGETPLHSACLSGSLKTVHILLCGHAANESNSFANNNKNNLQLLEARDNLGRTSLHHAAFSGNPELLHYLYSHHKANLTVVDASNWSLLHISVNRGHNRLVVYLLKHHKVDPNLQNDEGKTALHLGVESENPATCWVLVTLGDLKLATIENRRHQSPLQLLKMHKCRIMRNLAPNIEALINNDRLALHPWHLWLAYFLCPILCLILCFLLTKQIKYPYGYFIGVPLFGYSYLYFLHPYRIPHPTGWPSPAYMGLLICGAILVLISYLYYIAPFLYPSLLNSSVLIISGISTALLYFKSRTMPGFLPENYTHYTSEGREITLYDKANSDNVELEFCYVCGIIQPFRTKHCKLCNRCILGFDHHCTWLNRCVGRDNHRQFFILVSLMSIVVTHYMASAIVYCYLQCETSIPLKLLQCASKYHSMVFILFVCCAICMIFLTNSVLSQIVNVSQRGTYYFSGNKNIGFLMGIRNLLLFLRDYNEWSRISENNKIFSNP